MFKTNVPARFQTEQQSLYTVDEYGVLRDKVADPTRKSERAEKNIWYLIEKDSDTEILRAHVKVIENGEQKGPWLFSHVLHIMEDTYQLVLVQQGSSDKKQFIDMYRAPKKGMATFDIFCDANGKIPAKGHRAHVGHKITEIFESKGA